MCPSRAKDWIQVLRKWYSIDVWIIVNLPLGSTSSGFNVEVFFLKRHLNMFIRNSPRRSVDSWLTSFTFSFSKSGSYWSIFRFLFLIHRSASNLALPFFFFCSIVGWDRSGIQGRQEERFLWRHIQSKLPMRRQQSAQSESVDIYLKTIFTCPYVH